MSRLSLRLEARGLQPGEPVVIAVDASGIKVSNRVDWMRKASLYNLYIAMTQTV